MTGPATAEPLGTVLADLRLRAVVTALGTAEESLTVGELARRIVSSDAVPDGQIESVEVELYHDCLPRLADLGVVSFDRESMTATLTYDYARFEAALDAMNGALDTLYE